MIRRTAKTRPWTQIAEFYRSGIDEHGWQFQPMLALVGQIATSRYANGIYADTNLWDLLIVQTPEYYVDGEILRLSYHPDQRQFRFEFQETASQSERWNRRCSADQAFRTFERFLILKKWFTNV